MRWMGWLLRLIATVVVVCALTVMTTGYVVNAYIQSLLESYHLPITAEAPSLGSVVKGMLGLGGKDRDEEAKKTALDADPQAGSSAGSKNEGDSSGRTGTGATGTGTGGTGTGATGTGGGTAGAGASGASGTASDKVGAGSSTGGANASGTNAGANTGVNTGVNAGANAGGGVDAKAGADDAGQTPPEDALSVMGGISGGADGPEATGSGQAPQVVVTPDQMVAMKDELPAKEKEEVFAMLMAKLPQEEMQRITELMEDGLTEKELIEIEQILSKHLNKTEYAKIMDLLKNE
ncbi:hypothetical protein J25TS5_24430 [Paenibacillus faecis]|uniref:hypothetical protein n=1 Tax=Paenibacillus faecis TaxID=862114 RepID=UPI001B1689A5|nr:hypothetical protein [Paenibacillus faecis]GIO85511.1 hypothetical protein J25TS5_24430 [Paenibacillus faecis]